MQKVGIGATLVETFGFVGAAWRGAWGAMLLLVGANAAMQTLEALSGDWAVAASLLSLAVMLFVSTAASGGLYRLRLSGDHPGDGAYALGPGGLQWGRLEWRLMGANVLVGIMLGVLLFVAFILLLIVLAVTGADSNTALLRTINNGSPSEELAAFYQLALGPAGFLSALVLIPTFVGAFYLAARFATLTPLATDARSFNVGRAWALTRGAVGAILLTMLAIFITEFLVNTALNFVVGVLAGVAGHPGSAKTWAGIVGDAVGVGLNLPLFAGLQLYIYRTQRGDPAVAAAFA